MYPMYNHLSWSFYIAIISGFVHAYGAWYLYKVGWLNLFVNWTRTKSILIFRMLESLMNKEGKVRI